MLFYYSARASDGAALSGALEAASRDQAVGHLRMRSLYVTSLEQAISARGVLASLGARVLRNDRSRAVFFRSFATLIGAGVSVRRSLETVIAQCRDARFAETLRSVAADVEAGAALSVAMERHPMDFSHIAIAMTRAGETAGALDAALLGIAGLEERSRAMRQRLSAALAYPGIVTVAAVALVLFLVGSTMPAFAAMFAQLHVELPPGTRALIALGELLHRPPTWVVLAASVGAIVSAYRTIDRSEGALAEAFHRGQLALPILGAIQAKSAVARFSRTLGTLLRAGVDVISAIDAARDVVGNPAYRHGLKYLTAALRRGDTLLQPLDACGLFDGTFLQLVRAGEESGTLDAMLLRLAEFYELDVETALTTLGSVIEPVLICVLGAAVGSIVASIIIPLYSMIGSIT
jgi:type IV pilus assembly protein PilC